MAINEFIRYIIRLNYFLNAGELNIIHIVPNNSPILSKPFTPQIRRCQECIQKIYNIQNVLIKKKVYKPRQQYTQKKTCSSQLKAILQLISHKYQEYKKQKSMSILDQIDEQVDQFWSKYQSIKKRQDSLASKLLFYRENIAIIKAGQKWFGVKNYKSSDQIFADKLIEQNYQRVFHGQQGLTIKCGVIFNSDQNKFSRTIFRITKGNSYVKFIPMNQLFQKVTSSQQKKSIYFIMVPTRNDSYFQRKLTRFINNYNIYQEEPYRLPNNQAEYVKILNQLNTQFNQTDHLLTMVQKQIFLFYHKILGVDQNQDIFELANKPSHLHEFKKIELMKVYLLKQLQIFNQLNQMQLFNNFLQAQIYLKRNRIQQLQNALTNFQKQTRQPSGHLIPIQKSDQVNKKVPTLFQINDYTSSSQQIVQTYGVPRYRQANPALFTTVTFPFLFGVMFGDIAHGIILFFFGLSLIFFKDYLSRRSFIYKMMIPHRYLLALMGFFATYCGFIYNDFLAINLNIFGSCYNINTAQQGQPIQLIDQNCVYPFGLDPVWGIAQNNLNYLNSLKMKISVIIGVVHMTLGVIIKATNSLYFKRKIQFLFEFIPQFLFLVLVFGYMDFLIIFKWLKNWGYGNIHAPSIISTMINLPLTLGQTDKQCCHGAQPMWGTVESTSQDQIQVFILVVSVLCIPIMLLVKPLHEISKLKIMKDYGYKARTNSLQQQFQQESNYLRQKIFEESHKHEKEIQMVSLGLQHTVDSKSDKDSDQSSDPENSIQEHEPSEILVHQIIETIQYVLGCISNTASYLRLWALSLAHSQLAQVFLNKTVQNPIQDGYSGILGMILFFPIFAAATFGVLMCMDVMQCFLHTLRLHWVQFQNKFYKGDGYAFNSYNFIKKINLEVSKQRNISD